MTKRDFTDAAKERLLGIVNEVAGQDNYPGGQFGDWVADRWYGLEHYLNGFDMGSTLASENTYYRKVIDMNNMSAQKINQIWANVNDVNIQHSSRLAAILSSLEDLTQQTRNLTDTINPSTGKFNTSYINSKLKDGINDYTAEAALLKKLVEKGLTEKDLHGKSPEELAKWLGPFARAFAKIAPGVSIGQDRYIPIGKNIGIIIGNSTSTSGKGPLHIDFTGTIKGNSSEIELMAFADLEHDGWEYKQSFSGQKIEYSWSKKNGNHSDKITVKTDRFGKSLDIDYESGTEIENEGSVATHVGLNILKHNDWKPLNPHPVEPQKPPIATIRKGWNKIPKPIRVIAKSILEIGKKYLEKRFHIPSKIPKMQKAA
ncbi:hypothetical protein OZX67_08465 [Bifidobacterium sp. ESL0728]|uniref:hypothetical protein n=1 Tax=Bifidobacterium sp. ESL0728 TaxID=2983220 RepID=UPI0023F98E9B|nr:hypothetical protein [Bifidobacterium sp. ESL0728]WEV58810.1 hypothetical protein OZX67_08465 [Bifidobacterium sp. ESL0728]